MRYDVDRYLATVSRLDDADIDYDEFVRTPLDPATLRCLRYFHDVEFHTTCYLRDLLTTSVHDDPEMTAFLAMWAYEEHWHGEAIARVLERGGERAGADRVREVRHRVGRDRLRTLGFVTLGAITDHTAALAVTWGAVNEWTTQAGYLQLARRSGHPELSRLLRRIARQEGRHIDFYASRAERLLRDPGAQRLVRFALRRKWKPVGSNVMPSAETRHLVRHLFADDDGRRMTRRIDDRIARLPGLDGLRIVDDATLAAA